MRISKIRISQILGLDSYEFEPGQFNLIAGGNATGKTSLIEALKALVAEGGNDVTLLRKGAKKGEVAIEFEEDGAQLLAQLSVTPSGTYRRLTSPTHGEIAKPRAMFAKLADAMAANPIAFVAAPPAQRAEILLDSMPMRVTREQIQTAIGWPLGAFEIGSVDGHALEVIERVFQGLYDDRTGINRAAKEKRATVATLEPGLPPAPGEDDPEEALGELDRRRGGVEIQATEARRALAAEKFDAIAAANAKSAAAVREIEARRALEVEAASDAHVDAAAAIEANARAEYERLAVRKVELEQALRMAGTRALVARLKAESGVMEAKVEQLTDALAGLNRLKGALLADLPIKGLEIQGKELFYRGVPFDRVNTAEQWKIALAVAKLRAPKANGVQPIFADGCEKLDPKNREAFFAAAQKMEGIQFFVTVVSEGPLTVSVVNQKGG